MIEVVEEITEELTAALGQLLPQLSPTAPHPTRHSLEAMIASPQTILFIARDPEQDGAIVGMVTLVIYQTLTNLQAWIQDLVVDEGARGKGFGAALAQACIQAASQANVRVVNLSCRPARRAANRLYHRLGFIQRETNFYYYPLTNSR
jgi:ribosomal protein S18 acetylase RimI-like enzyme